MHPEEQYKDYPKVISNEN